MLLCIQQVDAQLNLEMSSEENTVCNGIDCNYDGPSILINEILASPSVGDGSIYGTQSGLTREAEWIELYNPDQCEWVDISCYFLGNAAPDGSCEPGGFIIPEGSIVPPQGFAIVRGINAPAVDPLLLVENGGNTIEIVLDNNSAICLGNSWRLWFPNLGGWFAFYDNNGVPQDAISWYQSQCVSTPSCNPGPINGCDYSGPLMDYDDIPNDRKTYVSSSAPQTDRSWKRVPDGGNWAYNTTYIPTYGTCNDDCIPEPEITCVGTASVNVAGGTAPYSYLWNDEMLQTTETATGLCEGNYCVTVTDGSGTTASACVEVINHGLSVTANSNSSLCSGETLLLSVSGDAGNTYEWTGPNGYTSTQENPEIPFSETTHSGTYHVTVTNENGCTGNSSETVSISPTPDPDAGPDESVCGMEYSLNAVITSPSNNLQWTQVSGPGNANFINALSAQTNVTVNSPGTYEFLFTETHNGETICEASDMVSITFNQILDPTITPITDMCRTDEIQELIIQNIGTITSYPDISNQTLTGYINPSSLDPGDYTIINTVSGPCTTSPQSEISFSVFDEIEVIDFNDQNCVNSQSEYEVTFSVIDSDGNPTSNYLVNGNSQEDSDFLETHSSGSSYTYVITDLHGCNSFDFSGFRDCNCPAPGTMSSLQLIQLCGNECTGAYVSHNQDSLMIGNSHFEFFIHNGDHNAIAYNSTPDFCRTDIGAEFNQTYYISPVSGYDENFDSHVISTESCYSTGQGTPVMWKQIPIADAGVTNDTCGHSIQLHGSEVPAGMIGYWSSSCNFWAGNGTNINSPDMYANVSDYGDCTFTWNIVNGQCTGSDDVIMTFNTIPIPFAGNDTITCGTTIELSADQSISGSTMQWSGNASFSSANSPTTNVTVANHGTYWFTVTEYNGSCVNQDEIKVSFIPGPQPIITNSMDSICGTSHHLQANNVNGEGYWSAWVDGNQIYPSFSDNTNPECDVNLSNWSGTFRTVEFIWTETNSYQGVQCTGQASCTLTFAKPTNAFVGIDNYIEHCGNTISLEANMTGNNPEDEGHWIIPDVIGVFSDGSQSPETDFTLTSTGSFGGSADVEFDAYWTVTNGVCYDLDTIHIHLYQRPVAYAGIDQQVCGLYADIGAIFDLPEGSPNYTADGMWSNIGSNPGYANFNPANSDSTSVNVEMPGIYELVWQENNSLLPSCKSTDTLKITFLEMPIIDCGDDFDVCGNTAQLNAVTSGHTILWSDVQGLNYSDFTIENPVVTYAGFGEVDIPAMINNGECVDIDSIRVHFWRRPSATELVADDDTTVCGRVFPRLRAENPGDGVVGNWISDPANGVNFQDQSYIDVVEVLNYGHYTFWWTESTGPDSEGPDFCSDTSDPFTVHFIEIPDANAGTDTVFCGYDGQMNAEISVDNGNSSGSWTDLSGNVIEFETINDPNSNVHSDVLTTDNPTYEYFELVWTEENYGCTNSDTVRVKFERIPIAEMTIIPPRCEGEPASIRANEDSLVNYNWQWNGGLIDSIWPANPQGGKYRHLVHWPNDDTSHIVSLSVENYWGCVSPIIQDTIYEPYRPTYKVVTYPDTCALGKGAFEFLPDTTTEYPSFSWFDVNGEEQPVPVGDTIFNIPAGTYEGTHQYLTFNNTWSTQYINLYGTDQCVDAIEFDIDTAGVVKAEFVVSAATDMNALVAPNAEVIFDNLSDGDDVRTSCTWYFGDGESENTCDEQVIHVYTEPNECYEPYLVVRVRDLPECRDTAFMECITIDDMSELEIPNIFTPNGDNMNDFFQVRAQTLQTFRGIIVNRWGRTIYEWTDYETMEAGWDGKLSGGSNASPGVYYYIIKATGMDGVEYDESGPFHLVREKQ